MSEKKINVLAVIDEVIRGQEVMGADESLIDDTRKSRAAIAELIEAAKGIGTPGGEPDWIESRRDRMKWARLDIFERDWLRFTAAIERVAANKL